MNMYKKYEHRGFLQRQSHMMLLVYSVHILLEHLYTYKHNSGDSIHIHNVHTSACALTQHTDTLIHSVYVT